MDRIHAKAKNEPYLTERSLGQGFGQGLITLSLEIIQHQSQERACMIMLVSGVK